MSPKWGHEGPAARTEWATRRRPRGPGRNGENELGSGPSHMTTRKDIWGLYFARLLDLLRQERPRLEKLIREQVRDEIALRYPRLDERTSKYQEVAVGFLEERLCEYRDDYWETYLQPLATGASAAEIRDVSRQLGWYDMQPEEEEIDQRIETGLNLRQSPDNIVGALIQEFGAFPNKSIIRAYSAQPKTNYLPEYALAVAIQQVVSES